MRLVKTEEGKKQYHVSWIVNGEDKAEVFDKRGQMFGLVRALRMMGLEFKVISVTVQPLNAIESPEDEEEA